LAGAQTPLGELIRPQVPLAGFKGPTSEAKERRGMEGRNKGPHGREGEG